MGRPFTRILNLEHAAAHLAALPLDAQLDAKEMCIAFDLEPNPHIINTLVYKKRLPPPLAPA